MIDGRPLMKRAVTVCVQQHNNDLAIATLHPLPQEQVDFEVFRNVLTDSLQVHNGIAV